jgi:hypothetical protein
MTMRVSILSLFVLGLAGCNAHDEALAGGGGEDLYDDDDLPAGTCRDTGTDTDPCDTEGTTGAASPGAGDPGTGADACQSSAECPGGVCAAEFDPVTIQHGALACQFACIPLLDDAMWCSDDAACCVQGSVCTARGYCVLPEAGASTTGSTTE